MTATLRWTAAAASGVSALAVSALLVEIVLRWTLHRQILDHPNERSLHASPTPRGAGIALVAVVLGALILRLFADPAAPRTLMVLITCGALIAVLSWFDDLHSVSTSLRLAIHVVAAAATALAVGPIARLWIPFHGTVLFGLATSWVLTILWITGLTNAFNFIDGVDGLAALQGVIAGAGWLLIGNRLASPTLEFAGCILAASTLAVLIRNWQPARIFMGDVGSAFLGYILSALCVIAAQNGGRAATAGVLLVWPVVFDTSVTFLLRSARRADVFRAHRSHFYQRLVATGFSHSATASTYGALAGIGLIAAWAVVSNRFADAASSAVVVCALLVVAAVHLRERRISPR